GNIHPRTDDDYRQTHVHAAVPLGEPGEEAREIENEERGVNRHVEDTGDEREPSLLKSPEIAESAAHPGVVAAFDGERARKLANRVGGGQAPDERRDEEEQNSHAIAGSVDDVFGAVGA